MNIKTYSAPAVAQALEIMEYMAKTSKPVSYNEVSKQTAIPLNTVYRICCEFEKKGYLEKDIKSGLLGLGMAFYYIGQAACKQNDIRNAAMPYMNSLLEQFDETIHLCVYKNQKIIITDQVETSKPIRFHVETGTKLYPHASAFGKCVLAYLPPEELQIYWDEILIACTSNTIINPDKLKKELIKIKDDNIAYDNEEYIQGILCVGSAIFDSNNNVIGSIGIVCPKSRITGDELNNYAVVVKQYAKEISMKMGFRNEYI